MTAKEMKTWHKRFDENARKSAVAGDHILWLIDCAKLWTIEFVMDCQDQTHPQDRYPFQRREPPMPAAASEADGAVDRANENAIRGRI